MTEDAGFFRNLAGYATEVVRQRRKALQREPQTNVDSTGGGNRHTFGGQELSWDDLRDIKDIRDSGGQVAQLMEYKTLLNFGEGAEVHVEENDETTEIVDGDELTLQEWLEQVAFPKLDLLVLDLGADALWYPYAVGELQETVTGDFKRALPAEPHTLMPQTDEQGEVVAWNQRTKSRGGGHREQTLSADDLWHIVVNKSNARDETGISEVLRNREEIQAFKQNEEAINQAIELHGFPQRHVKVGKEDGAPVRDDDLRRVRTIFDPRTTDANTAYFTGQDVDVESLEAESFDFGAVHEMDMRNLTTALGLPLEAGNVGADGLGSGKPAELRFSLLKLAIKANQRSFGVQFVERVMRPVIRDYSPFDHTATVTLDIGDPLEDIGEVADLINSVGDYMTNNEARRKLDLPEPEDDDIGEAYRSPADIEKSEAGDPVEEGPFGGMFSDGDDRTMQDVEDVPMDDYPEAARENAQMALDAREDTGNPNDCLTSTGWAVANNLVSGDPISQSQLESMSAFERFEDDKEQGEEGRADCGWMAWKAWGGDEGIAWADDKQDELESARENAALGGGSGNPSRRCLGGVSDRDLQHAPEWDKPLMEMLQGVTDPDAAQDHALVSFAASETPEFVLERIKDAIRGGALFSEFDDVDSDRLMEFREMFADAVGTDDFTLDSITESVMEFADMDRDAAERIARTESSAALNSAREDGYDERGEGDELFYWTGAEPGDDRQTDACEWLIESTNPFHGGEPVPMNELQNMLDEAWTHDPEMSENMARPDSWVVHINERSTFAKAPENWRDL
jgi:hypothetical protein